MADVPEICDLVETKTLVAKAMGVTPATVSQWTLHGCEALKAKPYSLSAVREWLLDREKRTTFRRGRPQKDYRAEPAPDDDDAPGDDGATANDLRKRKLRWDARKAELDARIKAVQAQIIEDSYFSRAQVEAMFAERCSALAQGLELFPDSISHDVVMLVRGGKIARAEVVDVLRRGLDELREMFAHEDFVELLDQRVKRAEAGVTVGRGRGRPRRS